MQGADSSNIPTVFDDEHQHVGELYAKALLGAAETSGSLETVVAQLESIVTEVLDRQPAFEMALSNPKVSQQQRMDLLDKVFGQKLDPVLLRFLKVLCRRGRLGFIRSIQKSVVTMRDDALGRLRVSVTTAQPLNDSQRQELTEKLKSVFKSDVALSIKVNPAILGGILVRIGDTVFDGSLDGRLSQLKKIAAERAEQNLRAKFSSLAV
jgi:F-type H+-transporting ATPase subunit delta